MVNHFNSSGSIFFTASLVSPLKYGGIGMICIDPEKKMQKAAEKFTELGIESLLLHESNQDQMYLSYLQNAFKYLYRFAEKIILVTINPEDEMAILPFLSATPDLDLYICVNPLKKIPNDSYPNSIFVKYFTLISDNTIDGSSHFTDKDFSAFLLETAGSDLWDELVKTIQFL